MTASSSRVWRRRRRRPVRRSTGRGSRRSGSRSCGPGRRVRGARSWRRRPSRRRSRSGRAARRRSGGTRRGPRGREIRAPRARLVGALPLHGPGRGARSVGRRRRSPAPGRGGASRHVDGRPGSSPSSSRACVRPPVQRKRRSPECPCQSTVSGAAHDHRPGAELGTEVQIDLDVGVAQRASIRRSSTTGPGRRGTPRPRGTRSTPRVDTQRLRQIRLSWS